MRHKTHNKAVQCGMKFYLKMDAVVLWEKSCLIPVAS